MNNIYFYLEAMSIGLGIISIAISGILRIMVRRDERLRQEELGNDFIITISVIQVHY